MFQHSNTQLEDILNKDSLIRRCHWAIESTGIEIDHADNVNTLDHLCEKLERQKDLLNTLLREQAEMYSAYILSQLTSSDFDYIW